MAQITEDYVSFETSKLLKEKGFDEATHQYYKTITYLGTEANNVCIKTLDGIEDEPFNNSIYGFDLNGEDTGEYACPTLQMAMKWLREEKDVQIEISIVGTDTWESPTKWMYGFRCQTKDVIDRRNADFSSYEEACEAAIKYCLENLI